MGNYSLAFVGLGSNLSNPVNQISTALTGIASLTHSRQLKCATWYGSKAIGPGEQPDYINTVASVQTKLSPEQLLGALQVLEDKQGRQRDIRWGARTLDLDLLLYDNITCNSDKLILPHPEMKKRSFVLLPLYELMPSLVLPDGSKLRDLIRKCNVDELEPINHCVLA